MISFKAWKELNESLIGTSMLAGMTTPTAIAALGAQVSGNDIVKAEAGKMPEMEDDGDEDSDDMEDEMPKKKGKCSCEDRDYEDDMEEPKEESYFGNGLESFFCNCGSNDPKDGMCTKCNKYVVSESYNPSVVVEESLKWYKGDKSPLYAIASYAIKNYNPGKVLTEAAIAEVDGFIKSSQARKDIASVKKLALLRHQLGHLA